MKKLLESLSDGVRAFRQRYNEKGEELPDPRPVEVPLAFKRPPDLHEMVRRAVMSESWARRMAEQGLESEDEANDFDVGDPDVDSELARSELAYQMAEDRPREREELLSAANAVKEARAERARAERRRPVTRVEDNVNADSEIVLEDRKAARRPVE